MRINRLTAASALALAIPAAPALAQHEHMPGMSMPMPAKPAAKKPAPKKKITPVKKVVARSAPKKSSATKPAKAKSAPATKPGSMEGMAMPPPPAPTRPAPPEHLHMPGIEMPPDQATTDHAGHEHVMEGHELTSEGPGMAHHPGALGTYPLAREASGTAWQPDTSEHAGIHIMSGDWTIMGHGVLNLVYDHQGGRRGEDKLFPSGMLMGMARRPVGNGTFQLKAMLSPDPIMGKRGYPLLLASGETANGTDRLIDRQHPHDFFMELSASISQNLGSNGSVFLYAGLPGEPAFGPPTFMHRESIMDSPEAPITHHWLDSTHISFGVLTGGVVLGRAKLEVSRFNGREPDQHRWNIETAPLDSTAVRLSWNPTRELALQGSWGHFEDPEQLERGVDQKRWSASAMFTREVAPGWKLASTLAWGRKTIDDHGESLKDDAVAAEASLKHGGWTLFGRGEMTENRELLGLDEHGSAYRVGKVSLGAVHDWPIAENLSFGAGALASLNFVPDALEPLYGSSNPKGAMAFVRVKLD